MYSVVRVMSNLLANLPDILRQSSTVYNKYYGPANKNKNVQN